MSLFHLASLAEVDAAEWDAPLPNEQPFLRHAFLLALEESGSVRAGGGWQPDHLLWRENGALRAAIPGYRKRNSWGEYVFDHAWADACHRAGIHYYPKLLGAIPFSPVTGARVLGEAEAAAQLLAALHQQGRLSSAHINFTDARGDALLQQQPDWLMRLGCKYHWHNREYRDFQDFLDTLMSRKPKPNSCAKSESWWRRAALNLLVSRRRTARGSVGFRLHLLRQHLCGARPASLSDARLF